MSHIAMSLQDKLLYPSIPIAFLEDALLAAIYRGQDVEGLLLANDLSLQRLGQVGNRISIDQYARVLCQLRQQSKDAFLGFLSRPVPPDAFRVFSYGLVACRNLKELIDQANEFYALFNADFCWRLEEKGRDLLLRIELQPVLPVDYRFVIQSLLLMSVRLFGWLLGEDVEVKSASFSFSENATDNSLPYLFGPNIHYGSKMNALHIDSRYRDASLSCSRAQVEQMLKSTRHLFLLSRNSQALSQEVRRRLLLNKSCDWLAVGEVAGQLDLSPHQLWRKLRREGTTFLEIRDQIKRDWALVLLEDPANTVEHVASELRYCDVSAFRKAFKHWTGVQPGRYRHRADS